MRPRFFILPMFVASLAPLASAAELVRLTENNWATHAPQGKEVDAIHGDYALRNDRIVAVIADPVEGRNANMTTRDVGGSIIDLTHLDHPNDQITALIPLARKFSFRSARVESSKGTRIVLVCATQPAEGAATAQVRYTLEDGWSWVLVETTVANPTGQPITVELADEVRADKTFQFGTDADNGMAWAEDPWWEQAYGVAPVDPSLKGGLEKRNHQQALVYGEGPTRRQTIAPGGQATFARRVFCARHTLGLRSAADKLRGVEQSAVRLEVADADGPIRSAEIEVKLADARSLWGRTLADGSIDFALPPGSYPVSVVALGRTPGSFLMEIKGEGVKRRVEMDRPGYLVATITDEKGGKIPCKIQFIGVGGTNDPFFFHESGEHAVHNCYYSHDGKFRQAIAPGKYDVIVSHGPEFDAVFTRVDVGRGSQAPLIATLVRTVDTAGWVSTDFHSHSSPSGDNNSSQYGRVLNLLAEHVEFAPCTEHNRLDSYTPLLQRLGAERLMATAAGIELTGNPLPLNHQNAFPLILKPHTQDGGGPRTDGDPATQIERLAFWDGKSDKLVQQNHPNLLQLAWDRDLDGKPDGGHAATLAFMDVIEVHPPSDILQPPVVKNGVNTGENTIHAWLQLLNHGHRIPGVVNTDAHYNFHGSGGLRNFVKSPTDDPAAIQTLDVVHESEKGHIVMSTGPFMEVNLTSGPHAAIPGDLVAPSGESMLSIRVQCPNWLDIDRVQVLLNGRPDPKLNFTRASTPDKFADKVVKFELAIPLKLHRDTHVIVVAIGEKSTLGPVMGPSVGQSQPVAVSNPIYVDVDGNGFEPNLDALDAPRPSP